MSIIFFNIFFQNIDRFFKQSLNRLYVEMLVILQNEVYLGDLFKEKALF